MAAHKMENIIDDLSFSSSELESNFGIAINVLTNLENMDEKNLTVSELNVEEVEIDSDLPKFTDLLNNVCKDDDDFNLHTDTPELCNQPPANDLQRSKVTDLPVNESKCKNLFGHVETRTCGSLEGDNHPQVKEKSRKKKRKIRDKETLSSVGNERTNDDTTSKQPTTTSGIQELSQKTDQDQSIDSFDVDSEAWITAIRKREWADYITSRRVEYRKDPNYKEKQAKISRENRKKPKKEKSQDWWEKQRARKKKNSANQRKRDEERGIKRKKPKEDGHSKKQYQQQGENNDGSLTTTDPRVELLKNYQQNKTIGDPINTLGNSKLSGESVELEGSMAMLPPCLKTERKTINSKVHPVKNETKKVRFKLDNEGTDVTQPSLTCKNVCGKVTNIPSVKKTDNRKLIKNSCKVCQKPKASEKECFSEEHVDRKKKKKKAKSKYVSRPTLKIAGAKHNKCKSFVTESKKVDNANNTDVPNMKLLDPIMPHEQQMKSDKVFNTENVKKRKDDTLRDHFNDVGVTRKRKKTQKGPSLQTVMGVSDQNSVKCETKTQVEPVVELCGYFAEEVLVPPQIHENTLEVNYETWESFKARHGIISEYDKVKDNNVEDDEMKKKFEIKDIREALEMELTVYQTHRQRKKGESKIFLARVAFAAVGGPGCSHWNIEETIKPTGYESPDRCQL